MALTTIAQVEELGGLDAADDYLLFRYSGKPALDTHIQNSINVASAWVQTRAGLTIYNTTDPSVQTLLAQGEAYIALYYAYPPLRARRVLGTHYPLQQEDHAAFDELVNVDWLELAQSLLETYLTVEENGKPFAMPVFILGRFTDDSPANPALDPEETIVASILDRARSLSVGP